MSSLLFLEQEKEGKYATRKVLDFRKLNSYSEAWRSDFLSTVATVKSISLMDCVLNH